MMLTREQITNAAPYVVCVGVFSAFFFLGLYAHGPVMNGYEYNLLHFNVSEYSLWQKIAMLTSLGTVLLCKAAIIAAIYLDRQSEDAK